MSADAFRPAIAHGAPLADEPGIGPLTIPGYLRAVVDRFGPREAVVMRTATPDPAGTARWSYADLLDRSTEVARALIAAGVGKDARVGILMSNRAEWLSAMFGIAMAGGVVVALSTFSTPAELAHLLRASGVSLLLFEGRVVRKDFAATLAEIEPRIMSGPPGAIASTAFPFLRRLVAIGDAAAGGAIERWEDFLRGGDAIDPGQVTARADAVTPADTGALFFSSGTTSLPKGILHAQRALALQWWRWPRYMDIDAEKHPARVWTGNGFFWSGNISMMVGNALTSGGTMILQPAFDADDALDLIEAERVSFPIGRPHQWARLAASDKWATADLSSLYYVTYGATLFDHPTVSTDWTMCPAFGTTETLTILASVPANTPADRHAGSHGWPLPGNTIKVFDPATGAPVAIGERGEIAVKGPTLMIGYLGKTLDETFDPEGYFRTGDGGWVDADGRLFWEGRLTDIIKTGGANVSPVEVDEALAACPGVKRAQTVGVPHETLGEMVVACVVRHAGATLDEAAVTAFLKARLASFKVPRATLFFAEEEFAVTGNEKVKTAELRALAGTRLAARAAA